MKIYPTITTSNACVPSPSMLDSMRWPGKGFISCWFIRNLAILWQILSTFMTSLRAIFQQMNPFWWTHCSGKQIQRSWSGKYWTVTQHLGVQVNMMRVIGRISSPPLKGHGWKITQHSGRKGIPTWRMPSSCSTRIHSTTRPGQVGVTTNRHGCRHCVLTHIFCIQLLYFQHF